MVSVALAVQLTASLLTIAASWFYGNKSHAGPWLGLASQVPWNIIMFSGALWGLAPVNIMMLVIHVRNLLKWREEARTPKGRADAQREAVEATLLNAAAVQGDNAKRRSAKAYEVLSGGALR